MRKNRRYRYPGSIAAIALLTFFLLASCAKKELPKHSGDAMAVLASPIQLGFDTTLVVLTDYFDQGLPDSIRVPEGILYTLDDSLLTLVTSDAGIGPLALLKAWSDGEEYGIVLKRSSKIRYAYAFDPQGKAYTTVSLAGDINNWNPAATPLYLEDGLWKTDIVIDPGVYHYQVVCDGNWMLDPGNPEKADNNLGGFNSLMRVGDPGTVKGPHLMTSSFDAEGIVLQLSGNPDGFVPIALCDNSPIYDVKLDGTRLRISIPAWARERERSFIRVYSCNAEEAGNDVLIPLDHGKVVTDPAQLDRTDFEASVMYFVMTDRWYDGDPSNNPAALDGVLPPADYHGGDLAGILQKLREGWFEDMGVNTIWISPVTQGPLGAYGKWKDPETSFAAYHGYWPISSSQVDVRIGDEALLKELVDEAHARNINVLFDWVANHVHQEHPLYRDHPDWATPLYLPDGTMNVERWDQQRLTTWFDTFLPTLDLERAEVYEPMTDSALFWLEKYGVDGFRHDATKHIPEIYWRTLTRKMKSKAARQGHRVYQVGETFGSRELIGSYVGSGMLDAQFDFSLYFDARSVFALGSESFRKLDLSLLQSFRAYGYHNVMGNITGNHDMGRFTSYAGGGLSFSEEPKQAGWSRHVEVGDTLGYFRTAQLMTFIMSIPGIPVVYYGDEYGMAGGADPDNRRMMRFDGLNGHESWLREHTKNLAKLRRQHLSLSYGDFRVLELSDTTWAYARSWFGETALVCYNKGSDPVTLRIDLGGMQAGPDWEATFGSAWQLNGDILGITLPPYSSEVLISSVNQ